MLGNVKKWVFVAFKVVIVLLSFPTVGVFSFVVCPLILPSLSYTIQEPQTDDVCGKYLPMPATARFLREHYPNAQTWLEFNKNGTFEFNELPVGSHSENDNRTVTEHGEWRFRKSRYCTVGLIFTTGSGNCQSWLHIKDKDHLF